MPHAVSRLSRLPASQCCPKLDRSLLRDRAAETLRAYISSGRIPEGTRLTEREVSDMLGISRMPAREALQALEAEGLIIRRGQGRRVIELDEDAVRSIHQVRWTLEGLAAGLAAARACAEHATELEALSRDLAEAVHAGDPSRCTRCDLAIHRAIWRQAGNPYLLAILESLLGVIYVLNERVKLYGRADSARLLAQHRQLVEHITSGDDVGASSAVIGQLRAALEASLHTFHASQQSGADPG